MRRPCGIFLLKWLIGLGLVAGVGGAVPTPPKPEPAAPSAGDSIGPLVLRDESIDQVLALLERWTGKTVLRPQTLPGTTISVSLKGGITRPEAIRALETLLNLNGIAISVFDERFLKVTTLAVAKSEAPELITGSTLQLAPSGRIASKVFQLDFLRITEFMPQIQGLLSPAAGGSIVILDNANAAMVTDTLANLQRIETLVARFDQPALGGLQIKFYPLQFAKAGEVVAKMRMIIAGPMKSQLGTATTYNADERSNQVVVVSDVRLHGFFEDLISRLDVGSDLSTRNEIIYLKHAAAHDVATSLTQLVASQNNPGRMGSPAISKSAANSASPAPGVPLEAGEPAIVPMQFSSLLTVLPEERSNALIVSGTVGDIRLIRELVDKIDILLAQVRIEVVIAEVTLDDNHSSGISALGLNVQGDKLAGFNGVTTGLGVSNAVISRPGVVGSGAVDLAAEISIATTPRKSSANILSVPNIITSHNREGKIFVGESRPVISSYLNDTPAGGSTGSGYRSTVSSKDIGIALTVKPLIGNDGSVQLEIQQEVNDILGDVTIDGNPQPRVGRRSTSSFVSVKSGEIIVLGGLQRASESRSSSRLGPIPLIGDLLGTRSRGKTRTDLVFFLRPTILTNTPADSDATMAQVERFPPGPREEVKHVLASGPR